jgi:hypothetical protein
VLDLVDQLDLDPFLRGYRADGHGHPAYDPKTLLGVLLYAYAIGVHSSRQIQRRCTEDLAFRVLAGSQVLDHVTVARPPGVGSLAARAVLDYRHHEGANLSVRPAASRHICLETVPVISVYAVRAGPPPRAPSS